MITNILKEIEITKRVDLKGYTVLTNNFEGYVELFSRMSELNIDLKSLTVPCMVSIKPSYYETNIVIDYYTNSKELLTALVVSSADPNSNYNLTKFFTRFNEEFENVTEETFEKISQFEDKLKTTHLFELDTLLLENEEILSLLNSLIKQKIVSKPREVFNSTIGESYYTNIYLFARDISYYRFGETSRISVSESGNLCNGLFMVSKGLYNNYKLQQSDCSSIVKTLNKIKNKSFTDIAEFALADVNDIKFSILYLECVYSLIERIVNHE